MTPALQLSRDDGKGCRFRSASGPPLASLNESGCHHCPCLYLARVEGRAEVPVLRGSKCARRALRVCHQETEVRLSSWSLIGDQVVGTKLNPGLWSLNESPQQWEAEPFEAATWCESGGKMVSLTETWRWG